MESGQPTASRDRPKLAVGYLTLRFTADGFPRFSSISYSICCPSLSVLSPARSTAETWTASLRLDQSIALGWIEPLHGAARHFDLRSRSGVMLFWSATWSPRRRPSCTQLYFDA